MKARPLSVKIALIYVLACSIIWLAFGIIAGSGSHPKLPDNEIYRWVLSILSVLIGIFLLLMVYYLKKPNKIAWYLSVIFFISGTLVFIFDDIGWIDLLVMFIHLIPLVLLIKDRKWYTQ
jgi:lysylphosphatidylglycerol synthetase-like protein (DUF2156 family)